MVKINKIRGLLQTSAAHNSFIMLTLIVVIIFVSFDNCIANDFDKLSQLLVRVEKLENAEYKRNVVVKEQEVQIRSLQLQVLQERSAHARFEEIIKYEKQKNENLERRLNDQEKLIKEQSDIIAKLNNKVMEVNVETLMEEKRKRFLANDLETVAFHATLDQDAGLEHIHVGSTIPFPNVKLNIGAGYNNVSNVFVAPTAGLYIFSTSISSYWNDKGEVHVGIMKNGVYIAGAYVDDIGGPPEQGSVTIALLLDVGDQVWVKHVVHDDGALYGGGLTSFMGCLIFGA